MKTFKNLELPSKGYYSLSVSNKNGDIVEGKCIKNNNNVITYNGAYISLFNNMLFSAHFAKVGTGVNEITRSSPDLGAPISVTTNSVGSARAGNEVDNLDGTSTLTLVRTMTFPLGSIVATISEVGIYLNGSGNPFIAGQLIKDEFGDPTTVTILADEQLTVTYTLEWTIPTTTKLVGTGSVVDENLNEYNYEVWVQPYFRVAAINDSNTSTCWPIRSTGLMTQLCNVSGGTIGAINQSGSGSITNNNGIVTCSSNLVTWTPTSVSGVIGFVSAWGTGNSASANYRVSDTSIVLHGGGSGGAPAVIVKFLDPVNKTSSDTFAISIDFAISL